MISVDDFHEKNIELANIIKRYGLEKDTIFFVECIGANAQDQIKELSNMGFQIGSHTFTHAQLNLINEEQARWEIEGSKKVIEQITEKPCDWFCYPRGRYSDRIIEIVKNAGYKYARTTKIKDGKTDFEKGGFHLTYPRKEYKGQDAFEFAYDRVANPKNWHFWGHEFEIIRFSLEKKFEEFLKWYTDKSNK